MKITATAEEEVESIISHSSIESNDEAGDPELQEEKESQVTRNKVADSAAVLETQVDCEIGDTEDTNSDLATSEKEEKIDKKRKGTYFTRSRGNPPPFSKKLCRGDSLF